MNFLTVRHFHDENALKTHKQNGPLKPGQETLAEKTALRIIEKCNSSGKQKVKILTTTKTLRHSQTTTMITDILTREGVAFSIQHDERMEVMDQGDLSLPSEYIDGEWFTPLDVAWDAICDEAYGEQKNIFYRFGDHLNGKYPELQNAFTRVGESMGWSLIQKYELIHDLIHNKIAGPDELLVIVSQSDLPLLLIELLALQNNTTVTAENLPYKCWQVYKTGLQEEMYDYSATGDGNFDIPMGYVGEFDMSHFRESWFGSVISDARDILQKQYKKLYE